MKTRPALRKFELQSDLSADEVMRRLSSSVRPVPKRSLFNPFMPDGFFHGNVTGNHFEIKRDEYMNSVVISGNINSSPNGSFIEVIMKPSIFSAPFICGIIFVIVLLLFLHTSFISSLVLLLIISYGFYKKLGKPALDAMLAVGTITAEEVEAKKFFYAVVNAKEYIK